MATSSSHSSSSLQYSSGASNSSTSSSTAAVAAAASSSSTTFRPDKDTMWYFSAEQLENSPSRRHGIDAATELHLRQMTAYLIQDMGQRLDVSQLCINTAIVYMHRFYAFHSFTHFHRNGMASACIFLSCKVEEQPRKLEHVIRAAQLCTNPEQGRELPKEQYNEKAQDLVFNENVLLQTLGFDVAIDHPHTHVVKTCHLVKACKELAQTSYFLASNSLHLTSMCLQYKPTVVACFCIYLACKWSRWEIPQSTEGKHWFYYVDRNVTMDLLKLLTDEFIAIYEKSPARLKSKLHNIKQIAQKRTSEQPPTGPSTGLQLEQNMMTQHQSSRSSSQHGSSSRSHHHDNGDHKHKQQYGSRSSLPAQPSSKNPMMQPPNVPTQASSSRSSSSAAITRPPSSHPPTNPPRTSSSSSSQDPNYHKSRSSSNSLLPNGPLQKPLQKPSVGSSNPKDLLKDPNKKHYPPSSNSGSAVEMSKSDSMWNFNRTSKYDMHSVQHQQQQQQPSQSQQMPSKKQNSEALEFAQSYQQQSHNLGSKPNLFSPDWQQIQTSNSYPPNKRPISSDTLQNDDSIIQRDTKMRKLEGDGGLFGLNSSVPSTGMESNPDWQQIQSSNSYPQNKRPISSDALQNDDGIMQRDTKSRKLENEGGLFGINSVPSTGIETNPDLVSSLLKESISSGAVVGSGYIKQEILEEELPALPELQSNLSDITGLLPQNVLEIVQQQMNQDKDNQNYPQQLQIPPSFSQMMQMEEIPPVPTILPPQQHQQLQPQATQLTASLSQPLPQQQHSTTSPSADELSSKKSEKKKKKDKHKHKEKDKSKDKEEKDKKKHKKDKEKHKDRLSGTESEPVKLKISKDKLNLENGGSNHPSSGANDGFKIKIPKDKLNGYHDQQQMGGVGADGANGLRIKISKEKLESSGTEDGHSHSSSKKKDKDRDKEKKRSSGDFKMQQSGNGSSSNGGGSSSKNQSKIQHQQQPPPQHNHHHNMSQLFGDQSNEEDDDTEFLKWMPSNNHSSSSSSAAASSFNQINKSYQQSHHQQQQQNW